MHRGLTCKLLRLLRDRHMVRMIMEMVANRSFTLTTGNGKRSTAGYDASRIASHRDLSWLAPHLFNTYISDLPPPSPESMHMLTI